MKNIKIGILTVGLFAFAIACTSNEGGSQNSPAETQSSEGSDTSNVLDSVSSDTLGTTGNDSVQ